MPLHDETASASKSDPNPPSETSAATTQSSTAATASTSSTPQPRPPINIGTRRSALARIQTEIVEQALRAAWPDETYVVHAMSTTGDLNQQTPLHDFGAKSLWTHELEAGLLDGKLDLVVHSLKDMPTQLPPTLAIGAILPREDPRDALVIKNYHRSFISSSQDPPAPPPTLSTLPPGSIIGTSSVRRMAQLKRFHPHLRFADVRGNVGTRLAKLDAADGEYAGLVLAVAGLTRLGLADRIACYLSSREGGVLHAVGQGALGIEVREGDEKTRRVVGRIACERTTRACLAERSLMRALEGGCSVPVCVETEWVDGEKGEIGKEAKEGKGVGTVTAADGLGRLTMRAAVVSLDGQDAVEAETTRSIGSREDADEFGLEVASCLVQKGADRILATINLNRNIIQEQGNA